MYKNWSSSVILMSTAVQESMKLPTLHENFQSLQVKRLRQAHHQVVYDWRLKSFVDDGVERKRSLRHSRLAAREYAFLEGRTGTCPATSIHILNLLPLMYLQRCGEGVAEIKADSMEVTLACLDERCIPHGSSRQASENQSWKGGVPG